MQGDGKGKWERLGATWGGRGGTRGHCGGPGAAPPVGSPRPSLRARKWRPEAASPCKRSEERPLPCSRRRTDRSSAAHPRPSRLASSLLFSPTPSCLVPPHSAYPTTPCPTPSALSAHPTLYTLIPSCPIPFHLLLCCMSTLVPSSPTLSLPHLVPSHPIPSTSRPVPSPFIPFILFHCILPYPIPSCPIPYPQSHLQHLRACMGQPHSTEQPQSMGGFTQAYSECGGFTGATQSLGGFPGVPQSVGGFSGHSELGGFPGVPHSISPGTQHGSGFLRDSGTPQAL